MQGGQNTSDVEKGDRKGRMRSSKLKSLASICVIRGQTFLAGILLLLSFSNAFAESDGLFSGFAESDFSVFWNDFKAAVIAGDKVKVVEMTKFPLSMPYETKAVKNEDDFVRRYDEIFKGEANAAQCFRSAEPHKQSDKQYEIYCPFKDTPEDKENAPIRFVFEMTRSGWRFTGLDNINE